jgi:hypothetical protein
VKTFESYCHAFFREKQQNSRKNRRLVNEFFFHLFGMTMKNIWLIIGAGGSFLVSGLHIYVVAVGAAAYRYFGAGEKFARAAEAGSWLPALVTLGIVLVFAILGVYALSGAKLMPKLPQMRYVILGTGIVYTLRGLVLIFELGVAMNVFAWRDGIRAQDPIFSAVSLSLGVVHLIGWRLLARS